MNSLKQVFDRYNISLTTWGPMALALVLGLGSVFLYYWAYSRPREPPLPEEKRVGGSIAEILVFPVKSLAGLSLQECEIDAHGFKYDRMYMMAVKEVMTAEELAKKGDDSPYAGKKNIHKFLTQREYPQLTLVKPTVDEASSTLTLRFKGDDHVLTLPLDMSKTLESIGSDGLPVMETVIWDQFVHAYDLEPVAQLSDPTGHILKTATPISDFFTQVVKIPIGVTLVYPQTRRNVDEKYNGPPPKEIGRVPQSSFQDYYPGNLVTQASIDALNEKIAERNESSEPPHKVCSLNFRPNLVLTGTVEAWDEDDWKDITIQSKDGKNKYDWFVSSHNVRCQVPTVLLEEGTFHSNREPYKTMASFRRIDKGAPYTPCFGMNLVQKSYGYKLSVGDKVTVNKRGPHHYVML